MYMYVITIIVTDVFVCHCRDFVKELQHVQFAPSDDLKQIIAADEEDGQPESTSANVN